MHPMRTAIPLGIFFTSRLSSPVPTSERNISPRKIVKERANPSISNDALVKRAEPTIGDGIDVNDPLRGGKLVPRPDTPTSGAFSNALELMSYATTTPGDKNDAVFRKYFNVGDRQIVMDVFNRLRGDAMGAAELANIRVVAGDPNDDDDDRYPAEPMSVNDKNELDKLL
ncbi:MAG: hypothetical protein Q9181_002168 [Wetmoreana brouardii]